MTEINNLAQNTVDLPVKPKKLPPIFPYLAVVAPPPPVLLRPLKTLLSQSLPKILAMKTLKLASPMAPLPRNLKMKPRVLWKQAA